MGNNNSNSVDQKMRESWLYDVDFVTLYVSPSGHAMNGWQGVGLWKTYDQVIEGIVADYLNQTAQPGETVRERQTKRKKCFHWWYPEWSIHFSPPGSVAGCHMWRPALLQQLQWTKLGGTQGYALPLLEV